MLEPHRQARRLSTASTPIRGLREDDHDAFSRCARRRLPVETLVERAAGSAPPHPNAPSSGSNRSLLKRGRAYQCLSWDLPVTQEAIKQRRPHAFTWPCSLSEDLARSSRSPSRTTAAGLTSPNTAAGFGLVGMRERVELLGGTLQVTSRLQSGTRLVAVAVRAAECGGTEPRLQSAHQLTEHGRRAPAYSPTARSSSSAAVAGRRAALPGE